MDGLQVGCSPWGRWVRHDWATSLSLFTFMHWRRKWQPPPVFLPGESQGWRSLVGCSYGVSQCWTWLKWLCSSRSSMGFSNGSAVRIHLPMQEMQVQSLGWEDLLEKEMATHSSILAWEIPWTQEPGGL